MNKYYQILNLSEGASKDEIKKAYRRLAMKYHPDVNPGSEAQSEFLKILEAYEYLSGIKKSQKANKGKKFTPEELDKIRDLILKAAKEKAREKQRERARKLRKKKEKEHARQYSQALYVLVAIIVLYFSVRKGNTWYREAIIANNPMETTAMITEIGQNKMVYVFFAEEERIEKSIYVHSHKIDMLSGNGLPLKIGNEFQLIYNIDKPNYHRINYEKVSSQTLNQYLYLVSEEFKSIYKEEWKGLSDSQIKVKADCLTLMTFSQFKFDGLSTIYFRESIFLENFSNNSISWYFLRNKESFKKMYEQCKVGL